MIKKLRERGLARYPGAHVKSPWPGHLDLAVKDKTFAYLSAPGDPPGLSLKLPLSHSLALQLPGSQPTPYGLGKSGWVSLSFEAHVPPPLAQLEEWLDESFRAQAPKKLLAEFEARSTDAVAKRRQRPTKPRPPKARGSTPAKQKTAKQTKRGGMKAYASFDLYLADQPTFHQRLIRRLRQFVRRVAPDLQESVKWGNGCWLQGKAPVAYVYAATDYVQFGFVRGSSLVDPRGLLEGDGQYVRHIKVRRPADIDERAFAALLRQAMG